MKPIIYLFILALSATTAFGQTPVKTNDRRSQICAKTFFDLSTGINNNGGILSIGIDAHVANNASINGGVGISGWGYKMYAGGKYYLKPCHEGWAFGGGATYSTGLPEFTFDMETVASSSEEVVLELKPQANLFAAAYRYWQLGKKRNRIYLQLGLSIPVTGDKYYQVSGNKLSSASNSLVRTIAPGGIIVGFGFSFAG